MVWLKSTVSTTSAIKLPRCLGLDFYVPGTKICPAVPWITTGLISTNLLHFSPPPSFPSYLPAFLPSSFFSFIISCLSAFLPLVNTQPGSVVSTRGRTANKTEKNSGLTELAFQYGRQVIKGINKQVRDPWNSEWTAFQTKGAGHANVLWQHMLDVCMMNNSVSLVSGEVVGNDIWRLANSWTTHSSCNLLYTVKECRVLVEQWPNMNYILTGLLCLLCEPQMVGG